MSRKHGHYHKEVSHLKSIDVYRVIDLFGVTDGAAQHALKKLLCAGQRGNKTFEQDMREAYDTLARRLQMFEEDRVPADFPNPEIAADAAAGLHEIDFPPAAGYVPEPQTNVFIPGDTGPTCAVRPPCPEKATHWHAAYERWVAEYPDTGYSEWYNGAWFCVKSSAITAKWLEGLQPIIR